MVEIITQQESAPPTMSEQLTLWASNTESGSTLGYLPQNPMNPHHTRRRVPWEKIKTSFFRGLNFSFTLNPDSQIDDYNNKQKMSSKLISLLVNNDKVTRAIYVAEIGKGGKLHFHGLIKTTDRASFSIEMLKVFNFRKEYMHRTLRTKHLDVSYRECYLRYMKKDNPLTCEWLYTIGHTHIIDY